MGKKHSTFAKMTIFYMGFGLIPLVLISMMFFHWYRRDVEKSTVSNYTQVAEYVGRNLSASVQSVDDLAGYMYDFTVEGYGHLYEILENDTLTQVERRVYLDKMLQDMMIGNEIISSLRFYTADGQGYTLFRSQGRSTQDESLILNEVPRIPENFHKMILMPAVNEKDYYTNTQEQVFTIVRHYMNTSNVKMIQEVCMGTLYIDINVDEIGKLVETVEVGEQGNIYVLNPDTGQWIFSTENAVYEMDRVVRLVRDAQGGQVLRQGKYWYFCRRLADTDYYVVIQIFTEDVMDTYIKNRTYILVILVFALVILTTAYTIFSGKMSDEMYMAKISQKEAELNALKMQIQPHYLYNTLDVIRMTAVENADDKTARLLESLAKQLRYVIGRQQERVPLYVELNNIREYIVLMNARYQNKFQLNVNVSDEDRGLYVLKLLLQPMVENSIKYGLRDKEGVGTVEVNVSRQEDCLEITVMDDGIGMTPEHTEEIQQILENQEDSIMDTGESGIEKGGVGIGFRNVYERIKYNCGDQYGFHVTSCEGVGTMVKFRLPLWEVENHVEDDLGR